MTFFTAFASHFSTVVLLMMKAALYTSITRASGHLVNYVLNVYIFLHHPFSRAVLFFSFPNGE